MSENNFVEHVTRTEWFASMFAVRRDRSQHGAASIGLKPLGPLTCEGGFCVRHFGAARPAIFRAANGCCYCDNCAMIWANKMRLGCRETYPG